MCMRGYRVLCATAARTRDAFHRERPWRKPQGQFRAFDRIDVLLINQLGYIPFEREATDLLFQLISARYERRSIAITTNLPSERWTEIFPDEMTATAVIDRLVHHGSVFVFSGRAIASRPGPGEVLPGPLTP